MLAGIPTTARGYEIWAGADSSLPMMSSRRARALSAISVLSTTLYFHGSRRSRQLLLLQPCACEVVYARKLAGELGFTQLGPTKIYEEGALVLAKKMHLRNRSKHVGLRFCFGQHLIQVAAGIIEPVHVASLSLLTP